MTRRQDELTTVAPESHTVWLAGQIDEVEAMFTPIRDEMLQLAHELRLTREDMHANTTRIVWSVIGACCTVISALIVYVATV